MTLRCKLYRPSGVLRRLGPHVQNAFRHPSSTATLATFRGHIVTEFVPLF